MTGETFQQWRLAAIEDGCSWARDDATARAIFQSLPQAQTTAEQSARAWPALVERRLAVLERLIGKPGHGGLLILAVGDALAKIRQEHLEGVNDVRKRLDMPLIRPRVRVKAGSAAW
jgi:hypothetical protein